MLSGSERSADPDVFYVFKMILGSVKRSYERRVAAIVPKPLATETGNAIRPGRGHCPMLDPNLAVYFDQEVETQMEDSTYGGSWDFSKASLVNTPPNGNVLANVNNPPVRPVYFDLWATMTGNWAGEN